MLKSIEDPLEQIRCYTKVFKRLKNIFLNCPVLNARRIKDSLLLQKLKTFFLVDILDMFLTICSVFEYVHLFSILTLILKNPF